MKRSFLPPPSNPLLISDYNHTIQAETINRLLKKQSSRRNKKATQTSTPVGEGEDSEAGEEGEGGDVGVGVSGAVDSVALFRWISNAQGITFSTPNAFLPDNAEDTADLGRSQAVVVKMAAVCDVEGCTEKRKYRVVKDFGKGACGIGHLKELERRVMCV